MARKARSTSPPPFAIFFEEQHQRQRTVEWTVTIFGLMIDALTADDFESVARERLSHMAWEFLASGAADEVTLRWNRESFERIRLRPRVLEDVTQIDTSISLFGQTMASPILLAPVAYQRLFHADGEVAAVKGAGLTGTTFVVSTATNTSIEELAAVATAPLWLQIYLQEDRSHTRALVERARAAGVGALCLTVDTPVVGTRNRQARANFRLPPELATPHLDTADRIRLGVISPKRVAVTWADVDWLRSIAGLPLLLKGILDPDDAALAIDHGADGIIVSNHGARNIDTVPATIDALPHIAARVSNRVPLLIDGGIRRGTDIVKALALGASAVLVGRPYICALATAGTDGVARLVTILRQELETAMALLGRSHLAALDRGVLWTL
jgi:4-hydroxymandelate oxidase